MARQDIALNSCQDPDLAIPSLGLPVGLRTFQLEQGYKLRPFYCLAWSARASAFSFPPLLDLHWHSSQVRSAAGLGTMDSERRNLAY